MGVSNLVPFCLIWGNDELRACEKEMFINRGISKYIEFWKLQMWVSIPIVVDVDLEDPIILP
jgi:hypothetical protein